MSNATPKNPSTSQASGKRLKAPFPWFGGKSRVADLVWDRFGDVPNYVEPFFGSGAVLLARPTSPRIETVNDLDCYIANFWRAVKYSPELVAIYADSPVNEADLHARHLWLVNREEFRERMKTDPDYFDVKVAGWWVWGISCWIGSGWCSKPEWNGRINAARAERGIHAHLENRRPHLASDNGVHTRRKRPNVGHSDAGIHNAETVQKTNQKRPRITGFSDAGVHSKPSLHHSNTPDRNPRNAGQQIWHKRPALHRSNRGTNAQLHQSLPDIAGSRSAAGRGVHGSGIADGARTQALIEWMQALADRLRSVRVCCGEWSRILGRSPTECIGITAVFLDPPYSAARDSGIYSTDDVKVAKHVKLWAIKNGNNPKLRIALCGYQGEHKMPKGWTCLAWKANGGHGNAAQGRGRSNAALERIWFSPHCLAPRSPELFDLH